MAIAQVIGAQMLSPQVLQAPMLGEQQLSLAAQRIPYT